MIPFHKKFVTLTFEPSIIITIMKHHIFPIAVVSVLLSALNSCSQTSHETALQDDSNTPLHLLQPDYKIPYGVPDKAAVKADLDKILRFLDASTPADVDEKGKILPGRFRLTSYEWGVTYSAMLTVGAVTGDQAFTEYTTRRHSFLAEQAPKAREILEAGGRLEGQMRQVVTPHVLDDAGAVCASMIKDLQAFPDLNLRPLIDNYMDLILNKEYRLPDGTFARKRPLMNTVWLDDLFMGVPAIAWYGKLTGESRYFDEAVQQIRLFEEKMWAPEKKLFRHGWVESMEDHPSFHWGRANGWAILTLCEVLDALPADHPGRASVLSLFKQHASGLAALQGGEGFWHQLLDRNDSYLETSATAIYAYCFAHGIDEGWLDATTYGPAACLAWNAVSTMIDEEGKVNGTCVGTGMAFDPAFYYYRPVSPYAAHGYGPVLLAGAGILKLITDRYPRLNDNAVQFYEEDLSANGPIFSVTK
jgi:rhamnogalacturonyl hydrolase YesR